MSDSEPGRWFEDFRVGERFTSAPRTVTETDLLDFTRLSGDDHPIHSGPDAILQGPFGIAVALGLLQSLGLHGSAVQGLLDTRWTYRRPIRVGDTLRLALTVIRCRRTASGTRGVVGRHMALVDAEGQVVQEGTTTALLSARGAGPDPMARAFGTVAWGEALVQRLGSDFAESTATWDGTIGLRAGIDEVHLRVYRGSVIEVTGRAPHGPTFTMEADEITWTELVDAERNDFMRYAMTGRIASRGNGYEYLRLTSTLAMIVDAARRLAEEES
ncbi:MaoC/PaaZ C-terminal domain-containing protein [Pseudonocardia spinosispora]|uniref:MaoC/PaaZ C-terminal domain-containing protein n=1 Tax=Pseudonocardia spinosispora TaxID=103441 RepID=UPI0004184929|nr:MaoC/PaaZ C-terminal domain-containing protein [Pseudonocardia spinosispora]